MDDYGNEVPILSTMSVKEFRERTGAIDKAAWLAQAPVADIREMAQYAHLFANAPLQKILRRVQKWLGEEPK